MIIFTLLNLFCFIFLKLLKIKERRNPIERFRDSRDFKEGK
jgi:hypothetical protein